MAIETDLPPFGFAPYNFSAASFDALGADHGAEAQLRMAMPCPCWNAATGQPDPACKQCYPFGYLWDAPVTTKVVGPNRREVKHYEQVGSFSDGDAFFTFPTDVIPTPWSRIVLPLSVATVFDTLTKGKEDVIRFSSCLSVEKAEYSLRVPPTGSPYEVELHALGFDGDAPDVTINGRTVTWNEPAKSAVPDGTRYVLRFRAYSEWIVRSRQDRNEHGNKMPYKFLCTQLDFLLHPRGEAKLSY